MNESLDGSHKIFWIRISVYGRNIGRVGSLWFVYKSSSDDHR